jgi:hypothetical protein
MSTSWTKLPGQALPGISGRASKGDSAGMGPVRNTEEANMSMTSTTTKAVEPKTKPTAESKTDKVVKLLRRKSGATISDLQKATGWQAHSVRGFLSGTLKRRMGLAVVGETDGKGVRRYRVATTKRAS